MADKPTYEELEQRIKDLEKVVSGHKHMKEALVQSEIKYRTLVGQLPVISYIASLDEYSATVYVSPQIEEILNISPAEYKTNPDFWVEHLHADDRVGNKEVFWR